MSSSNAVVKKYPFPDDFVWAAATSAYQVEGATDVDGRGPSIWDTYCKAGHCKDQSGDEACDSYTHWRRDIQMVKELGCKQYRISISWPRVLPDGTRKRVNLKGVEYYRNIFKELIKEGIEPMVTIFHWDLPQALQDRGGFLNPQIVDYFADYSDFCFEHFGDLVQQWTTFNEPIIFMMLGHAGFPFPHAPGGFKEYSDWAFYLASHHLLLAHAKAVKLYRQRRQDGGRIGIVLVTGHFYPFRDRHPEDMEAALNMKEFFLGMYANPVINGDYPEVVKRRVWEISQKQGRVVSRLPEFTEEEKRDLKGSVDFVGINYYFSFRIKALTEDENDVFRGDIRHVDIGGTQTAWLFNHPIGFRTSLLDFKRQYGDIPILITENGMKDPEDMTTALDDDGRIRFIRTHLMALSEAIHLDNVNVIGYTAWSLMDNFEWTAGYHERYGLYHVDFEHPDKTRTPKKSAHYYRDTIAANSVHGHDAELFGQLIETIEPEPECNLNKNKL